MKTNYLGKTFQVNFISQRHRKTLVVELFETQDERQFPLAPPLK